MGAAEVIAFEEVRHHEWKPRVSELRNNTHGGDAP